MKIRILLLLSILCSGLQPAIAQNQFAPTGSEWYHHMYYGVFHSYYSGDTVIQGITARRVERIAEYPLTAPVVLNLPTLFFYNHADTVFVFNHYFNRFTPLYLFNAVAGDTVKLPVLPTETGSLEDHGTDSTFQFVIDSVKMKLYDTATLKTVYTRSLGLHNPAAYVYSYGGFADTCGFYVERLGGKHIGLMPYCFSCIYLATESLQEQDTLLCYKDSFLKAVLSPGTCDPVAVKNLSEEKISIHPNPASNILQISGSDLANIAEVRLTNILGKNIATYFISLSNSLTLDVSNLQPGIYSLQLVYQSGERKYHKIELLAN